ncbi:MAG: MaoC family dehydratase [Nostocoides sp.]
MSIGVGTELPTRVVDRVSIEKMKTMAALLSDPNPIHWDRTATEALGMGPRTVNQGPINLSYVMNMLIAWADNDPTRLRGIRLRFMSNVFEDDRVEAGGRVTAVRDVDGEQLADCEVWLDVTGRGRALSGTAVVALA